MILTSWINVVISRDNITASWNSQVRTVFSSTWGRQLNSWKMPKNIWVFITMGKQTVLRYWRPADFKSALYCFWWFSPLSRPNPQQSSDSQIIQNNCHRFTTAMSYTVNTIVYVEWKMLGLAWLNSKAILFSLWNLHLLITTILSYWKTTILGNCDTVDTLRKIYYPGSQCH